jgi:peptidoglycan/LPS O-acetylase OafA/YrhL
MLVALAAPVASDARSVDRHSVGVLVGAQVENVISRRLAEFATGSGHTGPRRRRAAGPSDATHFYSPVGNRVFGLDLMRAVAILAVLLAHSQYLLQYAGLPAIPLFDGVDLFFVLSGFLIGGILLRTLSRQGVTPAVMIGFWRRRWLRTLPNYYLFLAINLLVAALAIPYAFAAFDWRFLLFSQNLTPFGVNHAFFPEAWSLSVEEWFYLSAPLLIGACALALRTRRIALCAAIVALVLIVVCPWARAWTYGAGLLTTAKAQDELVRKVVAVRLDSLAFGVLAVLFKQAAPNAWRRGRIVLAVTGLLLTVVVVAWQQHVWMTGLTWGYTTFYPTTLSFSFFCLLPALDTWRTASGSLARLVTFTSLISYSLYLAHYSLLIVPMQYYLRPASGAQALLEFAAFWLATYTIATLNYRFFESRILAFRDRRYADGRARVAALSTVEPARQEDGRRQSS